MFAKLLLPMVAEVLLGALLMPLTISSPPVFVDLPDATLAQNQPAKASVLKSLSRNAKHGAVRKEIIFMGFFKNGDTVPLPVSPVDGYTYSQSEVQYNFRLYSTRAPGGGFTSGQKTAPAVATSQPANTYYLLNDVEDSTGQVAVTDSYYKQDAAETVTGDGIMKVYAFCQRADETLIPGTVGPPGGALAGTIPDPTSWNLSADVYGNLRLAFNIPANADYRFAALDLLIDPEKTRIATALTAAMGTGDATIQVSSSEGFYVGDYISIQTEVLQITGPGTAGSQPSSTTWNVARAQKLSTAASAVIADLVIRLQDYPLHWGIAPGYTLDHPTGSLASGPYYVLPFRPGAMRIVYASLQLFGANDGATDLLEQSLDAFAFEPVVTGTLPGLRVFDGNHALIQVAGDVAVSAQAAAPLALPLEAGCIGLIYASTAADDGTPGGAPTGADLKGQLYIDGGGALGPVFDIPQSGGQILTSSLTLSGFGYAIGGIYTVWGGDFTAQVRVDGIALSGQITAYTLIAGGSGYVAGTIYPLLGGAGSGGAIDAVTVSSSGGSGASGIFFSGAQLGNVAGRVLTLAITQVGSTLPGRNLTVMITF